MKGLKISRKKKKTLLGRKIPKSSLKKLIRVCVSHMKGKIIYESREVFPYPFCPKCGCKSQTTYGPVSGDPESLQQHDCSRCAYTVAQQGLGEYYHWSQFFEENPEWGN